MQTTPTPSPQVTQLIDRIRSLVAEKRRLDGSSSRRREAIRLEIERLQERLANLVRRELSERGA
jgi:flagellin-like hook-associated protein FlgL